MKDTFVNESIMSDEVREASEGEPHRSHEISAGYGGAGFRRNGPGGLHDERLRLPPVHGAGCAPGPGKGKPGAGGNLPPCFPRRLCLSWRRWRRRPRRRPAATSAIPCICLRRCTLPTTAKITAFTAGSTATTRSAGPSSTRRRSRRKCRPLQRPACRRS